MRHLPRALRVRIGRRVAMLRQKAVDWEAVRWGAPALAFHLACTSPHRHEHLVAVTEHATPAQLLKWLIEAAQAGHLPFVRFLCPRAPKQGMNRALHWAAKRGHVGIVQVLVEHGARANSRQDAALQLAARQGHLEVVKYLLELPQTCGVYPGRRDSAALRQAARGGHVEVVRCLLSLPFQRGVKVYARNNAPLRRAARHGHAGVVQLLVELPFSRGVEVNAVNNQALRRAAENGHTAVVDLLVAQYCAPEEMRAYASCFALV